MTLISRLVFFKDEKKTPKQSSERINLGEISVVIPVKDNQAGIDNYLSAFFETHPPEYYPKEIIIVDNNSTTPVNINQWQECSGLPVILIHCLRPGPAAARNIGVKQAVGKWVLFNDSDCIPTANLLTGYLKADNNSLGYSGNVLALGKDRLSKYYQSQEILIPLKVYHSNGSFVPQYLITANSLVWRQAFLDINGFNETITIAGGEDVDLGLRLSHIGELSYSFDSIVLHNFDDGLAGFYRRFKRYGKGNRIIEEMWKVNMTPKPFKPNTASLPNCFFATLQYLFLMVGYSRQRLRLPR